MLAGAQKAWAAFVVATVGGIGTFLITDLPDNSTVQLWGGIIVGVVTVLGTTLGVYQTTNKIAGPTSHAGQPQL